MLQGRGVTVTMFATAREAADVFVGRLRAALVGADLLIVAGGDGTLHHTLPGVVGSGVPVYHLAMGTENLFARQFRMDRWPRTLEGAIAGWKVESVDVGLVSVHGTPSTWVELTVEGPEQTKVPVEDQTHFVLCCGVGPDASIIRRLDAARRGPISHLSYLKPVLAELWNPWLPRLTIEVDGN